MELQVLQNQNQKNKLKKGQGILEFIVLVVPVGLILFFIFQISFIACGKFYLNHLLYESLLCTAKGHSFFYCKGELWKKGKVFLVGSQLKNIQLKNNESQYSGFLLWKVKPWRIELKKTFRIPEDLLH